MNESMEKSTISPLIDSCQRKLQKFPVQFEKKKNNSPTAMPETDTKGSAVFLKRIPRMKSGKETKMNEYLNAPKSISFDSSQK